jgi:hypothetical protein
MECWNSVFCARSPEKGRKKAQAGRYGLPARVRIKRFALANRVCRQWGIFRQASVHSFGKTERALDDQKGMLRFAAGRRGTLLNQLRPFNTACRRPKGCWTPWYTKIRRASCRAPAPFGQQPLTTGAASKKRRASRRALAPFDQQPLIGGTASKKRHASRSALAPAVFDSAQRTIFHVYLLTITTSLSIKTSVWRLPFGD